MVKYDATVQSFYYLTTTGLKTHRNELCDTILWIDATKMLPQVKQKLIMLCNGELTKVLDELYRRRQVNDQS